MAIMSTCYYLGIHAERRNSREALLELKQKHSDELLEISKSRTYDEVVTSVTSK